VKPDIAGVAEYVAEMATGLKQMANTAGLEDLDFILGLACAEAKQIVAGAGQKAEASTVLQFDAKRKRPSPV
jgi:hypothetical protein